MGYCFVRGNNMKTIIAFSGGLDSTYGLWKVLSQTTDDVTAVFINTENMDPSLRTHYDLRGWGVAKVAEVIPIISWLQQNIRSFTFVDQQFTTDYVVRGFGNINNFQTYVARYALPQINSGSYDRLVIPSEKENDGFSNGGTIEVRRPGSIAAQEIFVSQATRGSIEFPLIDSNYTQANALLELPSELLSLTDICNVNDQSYKCQKRRWFQEQLDQGNTPAQVWDNYYANCTPVAGKWFSMKYWLTGTPQSESTLWDIPQWPISYEVPLSG
jgi:hypothetical protein